MKRRVLLRSSLYPCVLVMSLCLYLAGCSHKEEDLSGNTPDSHEAANPHSQEEHQEGEGDAHGHTHAHTAPHGGTLVILGEHFAIIEIVLDKALGKMTAYVLDGEGEKSIRLPQSSIEILIFKPESPAAGPPVGDLLRLDAVANPLTGETVGDTSEFCVTSGRLKGKERFDGLIQSITIKGEEMKSTAFKFPEGNE